MRKKKLTIILSLVAVVVVIVASTMAVQAIAGGALVKSFACESAPSVHKEQGYDSADLSRFPEVVLEIPAYERVAETDKLILFLRMDNMAVKLYDKRTQKVWSSSPEEEVIAQSATSDAVKDRMRSLFIFRYVDLSNIRAAERETTLYDAYPVIEREKIQNGVRLHFDFESLAIRFAMEFTLVDDELYCGIPDEYIFENEEMADEITAKKEDIQSRIDAFQRLADRFQQQLESSHYDETVVTVIKLFCNEIFNILVKAKETTGTDSFQPSQFEYIRTDILEIKSRLDESSGELFGMALEMEEQIGVIIDLTNELSETRAGGIIEMDIMPYFGTGQYGDDGYAFYPDAAGAISRFDILHTDAGGVYRQDVYDSFTPADKGKRLDETTTETISPALYPVFGVKNGSSAFAAVISAGDTDAAILFNPVTNSNAFGNVYSSLYFRQATSNNNDSGQSFSVYDKLRIKQDWEITYKFLADEAATYSGMANFYREYLQRNGRLARSPLMDRQMPLTAEFMMGIEPPQDNLLRNYIQLTAFSDIEDFAVQMRQEGVSSLLVNVDAWLNHYGKQTWQPLEPAGELGSRQELNSLTAYFRENDCLLSLTKTTAAFRKDDIPQLVRNNAAAKALNTISLETGEYMYMNPFYAYQSHMESLDTFARYGNNGITYQDLSENLYYDYNTKGATSRRETADVFNQLLEDSRQTVPYNVQTNASALYLGQTDWNIHMVSESSGYIFTDLEVPFYQMVFHGFLPYSSTPLNEASDLEQAKLKRLERGEVPFYRLTSELPAEIKLWYNTGLYSPYVSKWFSVMVEDYQEYAATYGQLWDKLMLSHEVLAEDVVRIRYEGGSEVLVNYTQQDYLYEGQVVPGQGSLVILNSAEE